VTTSVRPVAHRAARGQRLAIRPDGEPVVLRADSNARPDFVVGSPIQVVDRVQWFQVAAQQQSAGDAGRATWYKVDRPVYLALDAAVGIGSDTDQQLSEVIDRTIAAAAIDPGPPVKRRPLAQTDAAGPRPSSTMVASRVG